MQGGLHGGHGGGVGFIIALSDDELHVQGAHLIDDTLGRQSIVGEAALEGDGDIGEEQLVHPHHAQIRAMGVGPHGEDEGAVQPSPEADIAFLRRCGGDRHGGLTHAGDVEGLCGGEAEAEHTGHQGHAPAGTQEFRHRQDGDGEQGGDDQREDHEQEMPRLLDGDHAVEGVAQQQPDHQNTAIARQSASA